MNLAICDLYRWILFVRLAGHTERRQIFGRAPELNIAHGSASKPLRLHQPLLNIKRADTETGLLDISTEARKRGDISGLHRVNPTIRKSHVIAIRGFLRKQIVLNLLEGLEAACGPWKRRSQG